MLGRFRAARGRADTRSADDITTGEPASPVAQTGASDQLVVSSDLVLPEQPIILRPLVERQRVTIGEVLPARHGRALLPSIVPRVPKRAVFAVGIFAGLAVPAITRQLAERALIAALGPGRRSSDLADRAAIEIIRVTYASRKPGQAAAGVDKLLQRLVR